MRRGLAVLALLVACSGAQEREELQPPGTSPTPLEPQARDRTHHARASGARPMPAEDGNGSLYVPRASLDRVLAAGPGRLLQDVPIEPVFAAGHKFAGFRIVSLFRDDPRVLRFGILPGDVLLAVNGQRIVTPGDLMAAFDHMHRADQLEVSVLRAGTAKTFRFPVLPPLHEPPLPAVAPQPSPTDPPR